MRRHPSILTKRCWWWFETLGRGQVWDVKYAEIYQSRQRKPVSDRDVNVAHKRNDSNPASNRRSPWFTDEERAGLPTWQPIYWISVTFTGDVLERYTWWAQRSIPRKSTIWPESTTGSPAPRGWHVTKFDMIDSGVRVTPYADCIGNWTLAYTDHPSRSSEFVVGLTSKVTPLLLRLRLGFFCRIRASRGEILSSSRLKTANLCWRRQHRRISPT